MNSLQVFKSAEFGTVRTLTINEEPYFVGKDVAESLGYKKPENAIATHVDDEDKTTTLIQGTGTNYKSNTVIINESGLYSRKAFEEYMNHFYRKTSDELIIALVDELTRKKA